MKQTNKTLQFKYCWITALFMLGVVFNLSAARSYDLDELLDGNEVRIEGTVVDEGGTPVVGASVMLIDTYTGTVTGGDGKFSLTVPENSVLSVSCIGYVSQDVQVGTQKTIRIVMREDAQMMEEVVVVGFGSQKKVNLTGAVSTVDSKAFENRAVSNVSQALQGVMPGLNISQTKGFLDASPSINIRGTGTIGDGSSGSPLVLIDGVEGDINRLNAQDIESVSVLKDAAASSIYGSRAPFGVILITTKKGKAGKLTTTYSNSFRWQKPIHMPKFVDSYTFAYYFNETATNGGTTGHFSPERMQKIKDFQNGVISGGLDPGPNNSTMWADVYDNGYANTDWFDVMFKNTTFAHEHNVSVNGGSDKVAMFASANYFDQGGVMKLNSESNERISTNLKVTATLSDYVQFTYGIRYNNTRFERPSQLSEYMFSELTRQAWPTVPAYDPNGYMHANYTWALPIRDGGEAITRADETIHSFNMVITPLKGWRIVSDINYKKFNSRTHSASERLYNHDVNGDPIAYDGHNANSSVSEDFLADRYFNPNVYSDYENSWRGHNFKIMAGFQAEMLKRDEFNAGRLGIIIPGMDNIDNTSGTDGSGKTVSPTVGGKINKWNTVGFFGRFNYDYLGRYLLEVNMRYDGTSRFREDKRWKVFPSFSLGWNIAREKFFEPYTHIVSTLKPRFSWGKLGNQNTNVWYPTYQTMNVGTANGGWLINGSKPNTASAPGLISTSMGWETVRTYNLGLDVSMFNNRLNFTLEGFKRYTDDMIGPSPDMPVVLGTAVPKTNNTDLSTKGWEFSIAWRDRLKCGLGYHASFIISDSKTKITNYPDKTGTVTGYYTGKRMGEIWGYHTLGIAKTQAEMDAHLAKVDQSALGSNWSAGDIMYKDLNNDGKINTGNTTHDNLGDYRVIGNTTPRYSVGLTLGADYKGFDLNMFFQGVLKRDYFSSTQDFWGAGSGLWWSTAMKQHMNYFRNDPDHPLGENLNSYYPRPLWGDKNKKSQTRYLMDASYIRLKNLSLGYTIPERITNKWGISNLRISFTGENLFTITDTPSIFDPETLDSNGGKITYPLSRTFSFGISLTF